MNIKAYLQRRFLTENPRVTPLVALLRGGVLIAGAFVLAMLSAPYVYRVVLRLPDIATALGAGHLPALLRDPLNQGIDFIAGQPFRRVFDRVIVVLIVAALVLGWHWMGISFPFRRLYRRKRVFSRFLLWFAIGFVCIGLLIYGQVLGDLRHFRERTIWYLVKTGLSALLSAVAVSFFEEAFFRGFMLHAFRQRFKTLTAIVFTSAIFACVHLFSLDHFLQPIKDAAAQLAGTNPLDGVRLMVLFFQPLGEPQVVVPGLVGLFLAGWLLAELTVKTKTLWAAMGLHAGWVFAIKLLGRSWKYVEIPSSGPTWFYGEKFAATGVIGWIVVGALILVVNGVALYLVYRVVAAAVSRMPYGTAMRLGRSVGRLIYVATPRRRAVAMQNLQHAFPDRSTEELRLIARQSFETLGVTALEFLQFPAIVARHEELITHSGQHHIDDTLANGRGVIFFTGHFGSWEISALTCSCHGYPFTAVARPFNNVLIYRHVLKLRHAAGMDVLDKRGIARDVIRLLRENRLVGFVGDQYAGSGGMFVPFFGRPASTSPAMAMFARKTGAALLPAFDHILCNGKHHVTVHPPVDVPVTDDITRDVEQATAAMMHVLESEIRKHPGQWLWMHRKWRERTR